MKFNDEINRRAEREKTRCEILLERRAKMTDKDKIVMLQCVINFYSGICFFLTLGIFITGFVLALMLNKYFVIMCCIFPLIIGSFDEAFILDRFNPRNEDNHNDKSEEDDSKS